jgi:hypothetical protein
VKQRLKQNFGRELLRELRLEIMNWEGNRNWPWERRSVDKDEVKVT